MAHRVAIIEDEKDIVDLVRYNFRKEGFEVSGCITPTQVGKKSNGWNGIGCYTEYTGIGSETYRGRGMADVPGPELLDADEHALRRNDAPEGEGLLETDRIERARDRRVGGEDGLHLAGEVEPPGVLARVERPDAERVAREDEPARAAVPQRDGELPVEPCEGVVAPRFVRVDDDLGVAPRPETVPEATSVPSARRTVAAQKV